MEESINDETSGEAKFYLPASVPKPNVSRIETVLTDLLSGHGIVLIPDTYNE
jgi:hypothetical protein